MDLIEAAIAAYTNFMWGLPLVILLVGGGCFFMIHSRLRHFRYFSHSIGLLKGKFDDASEAASGDINHYGALATALAGTMGLGNITGVAIAITVGGPGAIFWMWITAIVGISTKFYTASLAIMYRGKDDEGKLQGGPMYVIREGLGRKWLPLAWMFAIAGMIGTMPIFQVNQLVQILRDVIAIPAGMATREEHFGFDIGAGVVLAIVMFSVALGKVKRVSAIAGKMVPSMVIFYFLITGVLLASHLGEIPAMFVLIFTDAFTGEAVSGGVLGAVILIGVQRGAFSNEAGIGTESLAHGAAKTNEPTREGLVAMIGPIADTLIVCTCTALALLVTGVWEGGGVGITMTTQAYEQVFPGYGAYLLLIMVIVLSTTTILTYWYYGSKCMGFLFGTSKERFYMYAYMVLIIAGAVVSLEVVINLLDGMYATMAIPTMVSTLLLAPKVKKVAGAYFARIDAGEFDEKKPSSTSNTIPSEN
jgi:AGCS family alanine or glycine:cation symporter